MDLDPRTVASVAAYDRHARAYQEAYRRVRPQADIRRFAALAGEGAVVLDVGCGPASDLRALRDAGLRPIGVDLSMGALTEARLLLPWIGLVRAPYHRLPFREHSVEGLWMWGAFDHLPRADWRPTFELVLRHLARGPVVFSCLLGDSDLAEEEDPVLGPVYRSRAPHTEVAAMLAGAGLADVTVEVRPDPILERKRPWVVARGVRHATSGALEAEASGG